MEYVACGLLVGNQEEYHKPVHPNDLMISFAEREQGNYQYLLV